MQDPPVHHNVKGAPKNPIEDVEMPIERRVRTTGKDDDGDITSLCNDGQHWSPRTKSDAISDIESSDYTYYVEEESPRSIVKVENRTTGKHLQTTADSSSKNNLDSLRNC